MVMAVCSSDIRFRHGVNVSGNFRCNNSLCYDERPDRSYALYRGTQCGESIITVIDKVHESSRREPLELEEAC